MKTKTTILFDMDGVLIDSEPLWRKAEIEIFKKVAIHLTDEDCESTAGLRIDEVVDHWYSKQPWTENVGLKKIDIENQIVDQLIEYIVQYGEPMPGVDEALSFIQQQRIPMAIASSSSYRIIEAVTDKLGIKDFFEVIYSAEEEEYGKPHPGIFLSAAKKMGTNPSACIVIEDSFNGIIAALGARMKVVAVPDRKHANKTKFDIATIKIGSLLEFDLNTLNNLR